MQRSIKWRVLWGVGIAVILVSGWSGFIKQKVGVGRDRRQVREYYSKNKKRVLQGVILALADRGYFITETAELLGIVKGKGYCENQRVINVQATVEQVKGKGKVTVRMYMGWDKGEELSERSYQEVFSGLERYYREMESSVKVHEKTSVSK